MSNTPDPYSGVTANADASGKAALQAIAQAGSAGKAQFDAAQQQVAQGRQDALGAALNKANLIGGPEAHDPGFANTIAKPYDLGANNISGLANNYAQNLALMQQSNSNYMNQVKAAVPIARAYQDQKYAAAMARLTKPMTDSALQTNYLGSAQTKEGELTDQQKKDLESAQNDTKTAQDSFDSAKNQLTKDQSLLDTVNKGREVASRSWSPWTGYMIPGTSISHTAYDPATVKKVSDKVAQDQAQLSALQSALDQKNKTLTDVQGRKLPALSELARQQAINDGLNPDRAAGLFGTAFDQKNVTSTPQYNQATKDIQPLLDKGVTRDQVFKAWASDYGDNPALYNQLIKDYGSLFPAAKTPKSDLAQAAQDSRDLASLKKNDPKAYQAYQKSHGN